MEFEEKDFNTDKVKLYGCLRQNMTKIYVHEFSSLEPPNLGPIFSARAENKCLTLSPG